MPMFLRVPDCDTRYGQKYVDTRSAYPYMLVELAKPWALTNVALWLFEVNAVHHYK